MKFEDLIPFVSENFITVPLWEEGDYTPYINFWLDKVKFKERYKNIDLNSDSAQKLSPFSDAELYVVNVGDVMVDLQLCVNGSFDIQKLIDIAARVVENTNTEWDDRVTLIKFRNDDKGILEKLHTIDGVTIKFPTDIYLDLNDDNATVKSIKCRQGMRIKPLTELSDYILSQAKSEGLIEEVEPKESDELAYEVSDIDEVRFRIPATIHAQVKDGVVIASAIEYIARDDSGAVHPDITLNDFILAYKEKCTILYSLKESKALTFEKLEDMVDPNAQWPPKIYENPEKYRYVFAEGLMKRIMDSIAREKDKE